MVLYRRSLIANAPYFLTATLRDRRSRLLVTHVESLRKAFAETRAIHAFETIAIVVLPDHLHWLCRLPEDDADFSTRIRLIKRSFTMQLIASGISIQKDRRGEYRLWQRRFWEHTIRDDQDLQNHADYIHYNPVKHGYVRAVRDWPHSSFHRYVRDRLLPDDWGGTASAAQPANDFGEPPGLP